MRFNVTVFFLLLFITSCRQDILVSDEFNFDDHLWAKNDIKTIEFDVTDTSQVYGMELQVEHTQDYAYQNLYVRIHTTFPSGEEQSSITSLELAAPDGSWSGDCSGKTCEIILPLQQQFRFPATGRYTWSIEPYMRMDTVLGIESMEIICKSKKE